MYRLLYHPTHAFTRSRLLFYLDGRYVVLINFLVFYSGKIFRVTVSANRFMVKSNPSTESKDKSVYVSKKPVECRQSEVYHHVPRPLPSANIYALLSLYILYTL